MTCDSCDSTGGGGGEGLGRLAAPPDPITPHSPPVRPSSLTPATLRTVLISCQENQLPSHTIQPPPQLIHLPTKLLSTLLPTSLLNSSYGIQVKRKVSWGLCAKYTHRWRGRSHNILGVVVVIQLSRSELRAALVASLMV